MIGLAHRSDVSTRNKSSSCIHSVGVSSTSPVAATLAAASPVGIPIGAVQLDSSHVQSFWDITNRTLCTIRREKIYFRGVQPFIGPRNRPATDGLQQGDGSDSSPSRLLLIYVAPVVAAALGDDGHPEMLEFLERHDGVYIPGLRRTRTDRTAKRSSRNAMHQTIPTAVTNNSNKASNPSDPTTSFTFSELFAGIGGFRLGLEAIGGRCVFANEIDPHAASIYRRNFSSSGCHLLEADILDVCAEKDIPPDIDILTGGFPCQPFSKRGEQRGLCDEKGQLYQEIVRVLRASRPKSFIFENVSGLVSMGLAGARERFGGHGRRKEDGEVGVVFQTILGAFEDCGYDVTWNMCNSRHYVAQQRERVFIVGLRKDLAREHDFNWDWYELLLQGGSDADVCSVVVRDIMEPPNSSAVSESILSRHQWAKLQEVHSKRNGIEYAIMDIDAKAPTLISSYRRSGNHTSKYIFNEKDGTKRKVPRFLTPRECCRIQGFPEEYDVPSIGKHGEIETAHFYLGIGNAVVPQVVAGVGKEVLRCLRF
mmetsp:Transcript_3901/g.8586  ORF Transcript_3901/g.8586 Transcript_3901/m.8586 type:complete len:537 (+) Transcript_3901:74-1684(+)